MSLQLALVLTYCILLMAIGLVAGRRVRVAGDFFVAGRRLGPGLLFATLLAANIGAGSTVGAAELGYRYGVSAWWWVGSAGLGSLALAFWMGPRIWRIAQRYDLRTAGDYLEHRYGVSVRGAVALLLWIGSVAILAVQLLGMALLFDVLFGWSRVVSCLVSGAIIAVYFSAGGLVSAVWVNLIQLAVLLSGFALALALALSSSGGWTAVAATLPTDASYWNVWTSDGAGWLLLVMLGPSFIVSPGLLQKVYGARDARAVRIGVAWNAVVLLIFAACPVVLGMIARSVLPALESPVLALPALLRDGMPAVIGSLGMAALLSAELSSADAVLFMLSTSLSQDLYGRFVYPAASDTQRLRVARGAAILATVLSAAMAITASSVADVLRIFYSLLTVSLFVPMVAGLHFPSIKTPEALASIAGGVGGMLAVRLLHSGPTVSGGLETAAGLAISLLCCVTMALLRRGLRPSSDAVVSER